LGKTNINIVKKITSRAYSEGLLIFSNLIDNILIMPPLTIGRDTLDKGLDILISIIRSFSKNK